MAAFRQGLAEAGFVEGRNVAIEFRWANNQLGQLPALAADLVGLPAAVIVAAGAASSPLAAKNATSTIPIVLAGGIDPVKRGFVASLNRPGGNVTGLTLLSTELLGKRLELLSQMVPQATTVAYLSGPSSSLMFEEDTGEILKAAQALGREFIVVEVRSPFDFEAPFATIAQRGAGALIVGIANAKTLVFASTTNTDHAPEGLSGSLRRTATTLRGDTVQRPPRATASWRRNSRISRCPRCL